MRLSDLADTSMATPARASAPTSAPAPAEPSVAALREFAVLLGEFRRTAVLVPIDPYGSLWTAEHGGVRWICAFSNEECLARFARAQGDAGREWEYRTLLGARLLDVLVPKLTAASGVPAGVALDAGSDDGMVFPPVEGVVPDSAVVDLGGGA
ncbi:SseB family protein [Streptomyces sp. NPDC002992]|uniref:SseB family protein n=1 Tax=Streptomyces sp. NPDC002992 TaxID=3154273 RepID=UPI00339F35D8